MLGPSMDGEWRSHLMCYAAVEQRCVNSKASCCAQGMPLHVARCISLCSHPTTSGLHGPCAFKASCTTDPKLACPSTRSRHQTHHTAAASSMMLLSVNSQLPNTSHHCRCAVHAQSVLHTQGRHHQCHVGRRLRQAQLDWQRATLLSCSLHSMLQ